MFALRGRSGYHTGMQCSLCQFQNGARAPSFAADAARVSPSLPRVPRPPMRRTGGFAASARRAPPRRCPHHRRSGRASRRRGVPIAGAFASRLRTADRSPVERPLPGPAVPAPPPDAGVPHVAQQQRPSLPRRHSHRRRRRAPPPRLRARASPRPSSYTPKHLAEKILTSKAAHRGRAQAGDRHVHDVSGFTAMSESLDPEDVHAIMDRAFEVILDGVHRYEGTINQFLGDGVMALFGAPSRTRTTRIARSAPRSPSRRGSSPARGRRAGSRRRVPVRIGINTGLVVVGAIGRDLRMDYTAVGDTTNLAARLLSVAKPGQIVVSQHTTRLTEGFFVFEDLGEFTLKGKTEPVAPSRWSSELRGRTRLEVSRERGLTPLVGRARRSRRGSGRVRPRGGGRGRRRAARGRARRRQVAPALRVHARIERRRRARAGGHLRLVRRAPSPIARSSRCCGQPRAHRRAARPADGDRGAPGRAAPCGRHRGRRGARPARALPRRSPSVRVPRPAAGRAAQGAHAPPALRLVLNVARAREPLRAHRREPALDRRQLAGVPPSSGGRRCAATACSCS